MLHGADENVDLGQVRDAGTMVAASVLDVVEQVSTCDRSEGCTRSYFAFMEWLASAHGMELEDMVRRIPDVSIHDIPDEFRSSERNEG